MPTEDHNDELTPARRSLWNENHGNLLLAVSAVIFSFGAMILLYQQYRESIRPVRFPSARSIQLPGEDNNPKDAAPDQKAVVITVSGAANTSGSMMIAIYDAGTKDFTVPTMKASRAISNGESTWAIPVDDLPTSFAVAAYHDENADEVLSLHALGIPVERYGFSNNARGIVGKPSFDDAIIERPEDGGEITIVIR